jgi:Family of unknown function (DUF5946)
MKHENNKSKATCEECGAPRVDGMICWEQIGAILAWEYRDSELAAEHFLTVASYNLQHPAQFTDEALNGLRASFIDYLDDGVPASELRRRASRAYEGAKRVLKPENERKPVLRLWEITVADVYIPDEPEGAAGRVKAWASSIRKTL